jgi:hypothetical protein
MVKGIAKVPPFLPMIAAVESSQSSSRPFKVMRARSERPKDAEVDEASRPS